jgi:hypothetical protein
VYNKSKFSKYSKARQLAQNRTSSKEFIEMKHITNRAAALIVVAAILLTAASCGNRSAEVTLPARIFEHQLVAFGDIEYTEYTRDEIAGKYETFASDFKAAKLPNEQAAVIFAEDDFTRELLQTSSIFTLKYNKNQTNTQVRDSYFAYFGYTFRTK